jgi:regulator of sigma D
VAPTATVTVEGYPVKKLSQAEMEERRQLNLCYNCNDKFSRGHSKVYSHLFVLDLDDT